VPRGDIDVPSCGNVNERCRALQNSIATFAGSVPRESRRVKRA